MPDYLISYDLKSGNPSPYRPFLDAAEKQGLLYVWEGKQYVSRLPNTTLWGIFSTTAAANAAFDAALAAASRDVGYSIKLEKRATTAMSASSILSDVRKEPDPRWTGRTSFETSRRHQLNDPLFR